MENNNHRSLIKRMIAGVTTVQDAQKLSCALYSLSHASDCLPMEGVLGPIDALQAQVQRLLQLCFGDEA